MTDFSCIIYYYCLEDFEYRNSISCGLCLIIIFIWRALCMSWTVQSMIFKVSSLRSMKFTLIVYKFFLPYNDNFKELSWYGIKYLKAICVILRSHFWLRAHEPEGRLLDWSSTAWSLQHSWKRPQSGVIRIRNKCTAVKYGANELLSLKKTLSNLIAVHLFLMI